MRSFGMAIAFEEGQQHGRQRLESETVKSKHWGAGGRMPTNYISSTLESNASPSRRGSSSHRPRHRHTIHLACLKVEYRHWTPGRQALPSSPPQSDHLPSSGIYRCQPPRATRAAIHSAQCLPQWKMDDTNTAKGKGSGFLCGRF